jgi:hypothetical protein
MIIKGIATSRIEICVFLQQYFMDCRSSNEIGNEHLT